MSRPFAMPIRHSAGLWRHQHLRGGEPALRLFCLAHSGGSAVVFRQWLDWLPQWVELVAVELGGRGTRMQEPAATDLREAAAALVPDILTLADRPFALFGHSMGALIAFELAQQLRRYGQAPACAFLAACPAPHQIARRRQLHRLPDGELIREIRRLNGTPRGVLDDPDMRRLVLRILRADLTMFETYVAEPGAMLDCDILALCGAADASVSEAEIVQWAAYSRAAFAVEHFPGDHFFVQSAAPLVLDIIARRLRELLSRG